MSAPPTDAEGGPLLVVPVAGTYLVAAAAVLADLPTPVRIVAVLAATVGATGLVLAARLGARGALERGVLGAVGAVAATMVGAQVLLYAGVWSPLALLVGLGLLSVAGAGRLRWRAVIAPRRASAER